MKKKGKNGEPDKAVPLPVTLCVGGEEILGAADQLNVAVVHERFRISGDQLKQNLRQERREKRLQEKGY